MMERNTDIHKENIRMKFMNRNRLIIPICVLYLILGLSGICSGRDQKSILSVKRIDFSKDKIGGEWVSIFCNQSCTPEIFSIEGENPRIVMDLKEVSHIQIKTRSMNTDGELVKRIRNYLDKETDKLRVVLDLKPSKSFIARPRHDPQENAYVIMIYEDASSPEAQSGESWVNRSSALKEESRITILPSDIGQKGIQDSKPKEVLPPLINRTENAPPVPAHQTAEKTSNPQSVSTGRAQMNAGEFSAAIDTFTQVIATHPQDSLAYRMRGNAYDNMGNYERAMQDWIQAARLGDAIMQSYLDFLGIRWRE
jgi:tetratricopeptide (TPR) repeat protein